MKRLFYLIGAVFFLGVLGSQLLCRSIAFRDAAGRLFGHGRLLAMTNGKGIYESDVGQEGFLSASDLVATENLRRLARNEPLDLAKVDRAQSLLGAQFGDENAFLRGVRSNGFSITSLREKIAGRLRSLEWLEKQIAQATTDEECRKFYELNSALFTQPVRFHVAHLFLAAPADTPPEIVESKREAIDALAARLAHGESFSQLVAEASEDEATKANGGDLGFVSAARIPSEFFAEVEKLRVGQLSKPFRSHLGYHILLVSEIRPARLLGFAEAREEISSAIANGKRALIDDRLAGTLSSATYVRSH